MQLLAKDALVLVLAYELRTLADCVKTALTSSDPFNMGMVIYYVTLGYAMPPSVHHNLVNCIKRWFTDNTRERAFKRNSPADYVRGNFDFYPYKYERLDKSR